MIAARGDFCPAVTARPAVIGPVRPSIAAVRGVGRSAGLLADRRQAASHVAAQQLPVVGAGQVQRQPVIAAVGDHHLRRPGRGSGPPFIECGAPATRVACGACKRFRQEPAGGREDHPAVADARLERPGGERSPGPAGQHRARRPAEELQEPGDRGKQRGCQPRVQHRDDLAAEANRPAEKPPAVGEQVKVGQVQVYRSAGNSHWDSDGGEACGRGQAGALGNACLHGDLRDQSLRCGRRRTGPRTGQEAGEPADGRACFRAAGCRVRLRAGRGRFGPAALPSGRPRWQRR
jgi:hypothetical protein